MLSASRGPSKGPCSPGKPFPTRSSPAWPSSRNFLALSRHLEAWTTRCRGRTALATLHGCPGAPAKGPRGFSSPVLVFLRIYCSVPTPCDLVHMLPRPRCLGRPCMGALGLPQRGHEGSPALCLCSCASTALSRLLAASSTCCRGRLVLATLHGCPGDPAKGATRVLQPCACVPAHLLFCPADSLRPQSHLLPQAALCWRPCGGCPGALANVSRGFSTALRACVPCGI